MSSFRKPFVVKREITGSWINGRWAKDPDTPPDTFEIMASVQPLSGSENELKSVPEGRRQSKGYKLYTDTKLNTSGENCPDIVVINGEDYELFNFGSWQNNVINHYRYIVLLKEAIE